MRHQRQVTLAAEQTAQLPYTPGIHLCMQLGIIGGHLDIGIKAAIAAVVHARTLRSALAKIKFTSLAQRNIAKGQQVRMIKFRAAPALSGGGIIATYAAVRRRIICKNRQSTV